MRTAKMIGAVVAGVMIWGLLWNLGTQAIQSAVPEITAGERIAHVGVLLGYVVYSALLGVLAGWLAAAIVGHDPMRTVWILAVVQLVIGLFVQYSYAHLFPIWYHVLFLAAVIPAHVAGGRLKAR